ncbi:MAG: glycosyltransferase family protein, partial [Candidatus Margulisbacteria bacterium]|nr:glycosyltransferase family protein [Candidatus Margulisiibacteriota bacterium]
MIKIIIQARMGSSRLPGKMMMPIIDEKGALELILERITRLELGQSYELIVATTNLEQDEIIYKTCEKIGVNCYQGHPTDVLDRYYNAANMGAHQPQVIIRLTGDCPLHDVSVIKQVYDDFVENNVDYVSNTNPPTYPDGLDVEVMTYKSLENAHHNATSAIEREHVTPYIRETKTKFKCLNYSAQHDYSHYRWTLDEPEDFEFIKKIYEYLYLKNKHFN